MDMEMVPGEQLVHSQHCGCLASCPAGQSQRRVDIPNHEGDPGGDRANTHSTVKKPERGALDANHPAQRRLRGAKTRTGQG